MGPARQAGVMALLAGEGGPRRVGRRSAAEQQVAPAVDAPDPPPYAHLRRATALAPGGAVFVSQDIVVLPSRSQGACHASPHWRRLIVDTIHLAASVVLSSALPIAVRGFWQWCKQRQAQQATDRLLQARPGCTAVTLQDNGAIRIEWSPDDPAGVRPLQGVPPHLLEQSITLTRVDRPVSADASRHDSAGLAPKPQLKGKGRARRKAWPCPPSTLAADCWRCSALSRSVGGRFCVHGMGGWVQVSEIDHLRQD